MLSEGNRSIIPFYSLGFFGIPSPPGSTLPGFLVYLYGHCRGQRGHDYNRQDKSEIPDDHVLFP